MVQVLRVHSETRTRKRGLLKLRWVIRFVLAVLAHGSFADFLGVLAEKGGLNFRQGLPYCKLALGVFLEFWSAFLNNDTLLLRLIPSRRAARVFYSR